MVGSPAASLSSVMRKSSSTAKAPSPVDVVTTSVERSEPRFVVHREIDRHGRSARVLYDLEEARAKPGRSERRPCASPAVLERDGARISTTSRPPSSRIASKANGGADGSRPSRGPPSKASFVPSSMSPHLPMSHAKPAHPLERPGTPRESGHPLDRTGRCRRPTRRRRAGRPRPCSARSGSVPRATSSPSDRPSASVSAVPTFVPRAILVAVHETVLVRVGVPGIPVRRLLPEVVQAVAVGIPGRIAGSHRIEGVVHLETIAETIAVAVRVLGILPSVAVGVGESVSIRVRHGREVHDRVEFGRVEAVECASSSATRLAATAAASVRFAAWTAKCITMARPPGGTWSSKANSTESLPGAVVDTELGWACARSSENTWTTVGSPRRRRHR